MISNARELRRKWPWPFACPPLARQPATTLRSARQQFAGKAIGRLAVAGANRQLASGRIAFVDQGNDSLASQSSPFGLFVGGHHAVVGLVQPHRHRLSGFQLPRAEIRLDRELRREPIRGLEIRHFGKIRDVDGSGIGGKSIVGLQAAGIAAPTLPLISRCEPAIRSRSPALR